MIYIFSALVSSVILHSNSVLGMKYVIVRSINDGAVDYVELEDNAVGTTTVRDICIDILRDKTKDMLFGNILDVVSYNNDTKICTSIGANNGWQFWLSSSVKLDCLFADSKVNTASIWLYKKGTEEPWNNFFESFNLDAIACATSCSRYEGIIGASPITRGKVAFRKPSDEYIEYKMASFECKHSAARKLYEREFSKKLNFNMPVILKKTKESNRGGEWHLEKRYNLDDLLENPFP